MYSLVLSVYDVNSRGERGGSGKADKDTNKLREWDSDKGEGIKSENVADVINGNPLKRNVKACPTFIGNIGFLWRTSPASFSGARGAAKWGRSTLRKNFNANANM